MSHGAESRVNNFFSFDVAELLTAVETSLRTVTSDGMQRLGFELEECNEATEIIDKRAELFSRYTRNNVFKVPEHVIAVELDELRSQRQNLERKHASQPASSKKKSNNKAESTSLATTADYYAAGAAVEQLEERLRELEHGTEQVHLLANKMEEYDTALSKLLASGRMGTVNQNNNQAALVQELDATHEQYNRLLAVLRNDKPVARPQAAQQSYQRANAANHSGQAFGW